MAEEKNAFEYFFEQDQRLQMFWLIFSKPSPNFLKPLESSSKSQSLKGVRVWVERLNRCLVKRSTKLFLTANTLFF
jgi:hypothetical protein